MRCVKTTRRANQSSQQKPVQPSRKKYFAFAVGQISTTSSPRPFPARGAYRDRHERGMGCGGRGSVGAQGDRRADLRSVSGSRRAGRTALVAYGKTVWSRHPLLVPSCRWPMSIQPDRISHQAGSDGDKTNSSPGSNCEVDLRSAGLKAGATRPPPPAADGLDPVRSQVFRLCMCSAEAERDRSCGSVLRPIFLAARSWC